MTPTRRHALAAVALGIVAVNWPAGAAERLPFDMKAFEAAQAAGKPIVVHVTAPWCGTCRVQKPIVSLLADRPAFKDLTIFDVDFDTHREALRLLNVRTQSTFIVLKGRMEVARSVGETRFEQIEALMRKAL